LIDSPLGCGLTGFRRAFFVIYTFHMPLFFMLSGLLVARRVARGTGPFLKGLLPSVVWPYFLWSILQFTLIYALGSLVNRPADNYWGTILALPWQTMSQFWFLYALFWMHVIAALVLPRFGPTGLVALGIALKVMVAVVVVPVSVKLVANNLIWYAIGAYLTPAGLAAMFVARPLAVRAVVLPLLAAGLIMAAYLGTSWFGADIPLATASSPEIANLAWRLPVLAAAITGAGATVAIASLPVFAGPNSRSGSLAEIGRLTMPIFVLHVMFIAGSRIVLTRLGHVTDPAVLLVVLVAAGLIGPLLAERILRPLRLQRWLGF
jgi:hypothetical protein